MAKADYGIDAPGIVRGLAAGGFALLCATLALPSLAPLQGPGIGLVAAATAMLLCSKIGKQRVCRRLIALHPWRGDEHVLDVGCGRGLSLIAAAKRLDKGGHATGIDLWSGKDLSGNAPERARENAELELVSKRVVIDTGDARALPYPDASFDVVTSMTAIHNIPQAEGRAQAFREMARVLRPGGRLLLFDIQHPFAYAAQLRDAGFEEVRRAGLTLIWMQPGIIWSAMKPA